MRPKPVDGRIITREEVSNRLRKYEERRRRKQARQEELFEEVFDRMRTKAISGI